MEKALVGNGMAKEYK